MNHPAAAASNGFFDDYDETLRTAWRGVAWRGGGGRGVVGGDLPTIRVRDTTRVNKPVQY